MEPEYSESGHTSRRRKHEDDGEDTRNDRTSKDRDRDSHKSRRRDRSRSREGREKTDGERRRRSATPNSKRRRSRNRERDTGTDSKRRRSRERDGDSRRDTDRDRDKHRRRDSPDDRRSRRHRDRDRDRDQDGESDRNHREHRRRRSPDEAAARRKSRRDADREEGRDKKDSGGRSLIKRNGPLPSQDDSFAVSKGEEPEKPKEKANFGQTGLLAAASNSVTQADGTSITLKYHEPAEARKPSPRDQWKLFVFKDSDIVDTIDLSARSCWLVGRETMVVDMLAEHPSISKQHAVIQFRYTEKRNEFGDKLGKVKPYLLDLESANGTLLNGDKVPDSRYLELRDKDMIQFGSSTREYVLMLAPRD